MDSYYVVTSLTDLTKNIWLSIYPKLSKAFNFKPTKYHLKVAIHNLPETMIQTACASA